MFRSGFMFCYEIWHMLETDQSGRALRVCLVPTRACYNFFFKVSFRDPVLPWLQIDFYKLAKAKLPSFALPELKFPHSKTWRCPLSPCQTWGHQTAPKITSSGLTFSRNFCSFLQSDSFTSTQFACSLPSIYVPPPLAFLLLLTISKYAQTLSHGV